METWLAWGEGELVEAPGSTNPGDFVSRSLCLSWGGLVVRVAAARSRPELRLDGSLTHGGCVARPSAASPGEKVSFHLSRKEGGWVEAKG